MQNLTNEFCELRKQYIDAKFMTMNPMQKKAIYNVDGPVLVLAGAGSGKTTTIIGRIVYMVMPITVRKPHSPLQKAISRN